MAAWHVDNGVIVFDEAVEKCGLAATMDAVELAEFKVLGARLAEHLAEIRRAAVWKARTATSVENHFNELRREELGLLLPLAWNCPLCDPRGGVPADHPELVTALWYEIKEELGPSSSYWKVPEDERFQWLMQRLDLPLGAS